MSKSLETVRVYVGVDRSQELAVPVLEHSIRRHTNLDVEVIPMLDLPVREPVDPRNSKRTGFSFARFCIPKLANYKGKAIYMDADMLVFDDIASLWNIPFDEAKIVIQEEITHQSTDKVGAPTKRIKQCAVMLLDCDNLDWEIDKIIDGFDDERYDYEDLMYHLCILKEEEVKYGVPFVWNSLEHYDSDTKLIHYTDVYTQPWTSVENKNAEVWFKEVRLMIKDGSLKWSDIQREIDLGYFRPSLIRDIKYSRFVPAPFKDLFKKAMIKMDEYAKFVPHKEVYENKRRRKKAIKAYEEKLNKQGDQELKDSKKVAT